jgi:hypothetical protein
VRAPAGRSGGAGSFDAVKGFLRKSGGCGTSATDAIAGDLEELVRRLERVRALGGTHAPVELSPYVASLLKKAGDREVAAVEGRLHPAQA